MDDVFTYVCDIGVFIGTIGFFLYCFLLYSRTFPVIAQAEIKTILKGTGDNYIRERANKDLHMSNKVVYAIYNDDILMDAVKQTRAAHHHIEEVFHFRFTVWIKQWALRLPD
jgi:hypothetical protein